MKAILHILMLGLLSMLFSCGQQNDKKKALVVVADSSQTILDKKEKERLEKRKQIEEQERIDSLKNAEILTEALEIATQNINKGRFHTEYDRVVDNGYYDVKVEINLDYHFTKDYSHLIIRRSGDPGNVYIDIYSKNNNTFEKVLSHEQWEFTYRYDTIQDINGDGLKDFVVNWYGSIGCCLRAFSAVYLLRPDKQTFSNEFEFINPKFSPKEKIIRGICYGHPGETEMYKYKWNGEKVDTLEYVYYEKNQNGDKTGKIIISTKRFPCEENNKILKRLNSVPNEYKKIDGYNWFLGF